MNTIQALKDLYVKVGGSLTDTYQGVAGGAAVSDYVTTPDCLKAIYAILGGDLSEVYTDISDTAVADYSVNPNAIEAISEIANPVPSGTKSITANGTGIDVAQYAKVNVNVVDSKFVDLVKRALSGTVELPASVRYVGSYAFYNCTGLSNVVFNVSAGENYQISDHAFHGCTNITTLDLRGFKTVYWSAFYGSGIETLYFSTDLTEFINGGSGGSVFDGATLLTDIYYTGTQAQWEAITGLSGAGIGSGVTVHYEYTPE